MTKQQPNEKITSYPLEQIVPISDNAPKPAAGLPTEVVNDKRRYRQHPITPFLDNFRIADHSSGTASVTSLMPVYDPRQFELSETPISCLSRQSFHCRMSLILV